MAYPDAQAGPAAYPSVNDQPNSHKLLGRRIVAIWIFNRGLEWEVLEPDQLQGPRFVEFGEALRIAEHLAALRRQELFIHFRPLANPLPKAPFSS